VARKSAKTTILKSTRVPLTAAQKRDLSEFSKRFKPVEGLEDLWRRHLKAQEANAHAWARFELLAARVDKKGYLHPEWPAFMQSGDDLEKAQRVELGTWDAYNYAMKHRFDKIGAPESDVRAIAKDTLQAALADGELQFTNNFGLLASHVAQAIRPLTTEEEIGDPPLCHECEKED
jgi:hypothetical protein